MTTLLCDTTDEHVVAALSAGGVLVAGSVAHGQRAQVMLDVVHHLLAGAGRVLADIDSIAIGVGPGGFTGTRVGVATARGLASSLGIPLAGLPTLAAIAAPALAVDPDLEVLASADARRNERFVQRWRVVDGALEPAGEVDVVAAADVDAAAASTQVQIVTGPATPEGLALVAASGMLEFGDPTEVVPTYGRTPDAQPGAWRGAPA